MQVAGIGCTYNVAYCRMHQLGCIYLLREKKKKQFGKVYHVGVGAADAGADCFFVTCYFFAFLILMQCELIGAYAYFNLLMHVTDITQ